MSTSEISVVSIGVFSHGSFGVDGIPVNGGAELWRVDCPELRDAVSRAYPAMADYSRFTFLHKSAADQFAENQIQVEADRAIAAKTAADAAEKVAAEKIAADKRQLINAVNDAVNAMFPGCVAAKIANDGSVIAGVWAAGLLPGHGRPLTVYKMTAIGIVQANPDYRYAF